MTEAETLIRAREAAIAAGFARNVGHNPESVRAEEKAIRAGLRDRHWGVLCALQALHDIDKPVADPDLIEAREILAAAVRDAGVLLPLADEWLEGRRDDAPAMKAVLVALRRGRLPAAVDAPSQQGSDQ